MSLGHHIWLFFVFSAIQPMLQQKMLEAMRMRKISQLERAQKSQVILLVHLDVPLEQTKLQNIEGSHEK
jgi:hypothetical protein